jgi:PAS domain S-box-containing protein
MEHARKMAEAAKAALQEANEGLESRVAERTAELGRSQKLIEQSELRMGGIVNSAMDAIISVDAGQRILLFNVAAERMFQCAAADAMGQPQDRFIPERFRMEHRRDMGEFGKTGVTSRSVQSLGALSAVRSNGEEFPIEASISQIDVAGEKVFTVILRDITERKGAEEALRVSAAHYRTLFEQAPDGIIIKNGNGPYIDANLRICQMLGYTREELIGLNGPDIVAQSEIENITPALEEIKGGSDYRREWQMRRKDGSVFPSEVRATLMPDGNLLAVLHDISERRKAERELREKQLALGSADRRLADIVHGMTEACFALDKDWRFTFVNDSSGDLLRHSREEMLGRSIWEVFDKLVGTPMEANYRRAMAERVPVAFEAFSPIAGRWLESGSSRRRKAWRRFCWTSRRARKRRPLCGSGRSDSVHTWSRRPTRCLCMISPGDSWR